MAWPARDHPSDPPARTLGPGQSPACSCEADALYNPALMTTLTTAGRDRANPGSASASSVSGGSVPPDRRRVLLISGLAGAGRTTALRALEDLGYEAVDNLPLELLPHLVAGIA